MEIETCAAGRNKTCGDLGGNKDLRYGNKEELLCG